MEIPESDVDGMGVCGGGLMPPVERQVGPRGRVLGGDPGGESKCKDVAKMLFLFFQALSSKGQKVLDPVVQIVEGRTGE